MMEAKFNIVDLCLNCSYLSVLVAIVLAGLIRKPKYFDAYSRAILITTILAQLIKLIDVILLNCDFKQYPSVSYLLVFGFNALQFMILDVFVFRLLMIRCMLDCTSLEQTKKEIKLVKKVTILFFIIMGLWTIAMGALLYNVMNNPEEEIGKVSATDISLLALFGVRLVVDLLMLFLFGG